MNIIILQSSLIKIQVIPMPDQVAILFGKQFEMKVLDMISELDATYTIISLFDKNIISTETIL
jgi:hypothetical protein